MTVIAESEQLYCGNCSDPVDAVDEDGCGRCCHDLPNPWHRGSDGLYTHPSFCENAEGEDDEDEDEDEDDRRPVCPHCGDSRFVIHAREWRQIALTGTVSGFDNEDYEDSTLWYDRDDFEDEGIADGGDFEIQRVVCTNCRNDVTDHVDVEQRY